MDTNGIEIFSGGIYARIINNSISVSDIAIKTGADYDLIQNNWLNGSREWTIYLDSCSSNFLNNNNLTNNIKDLAVGGGTILSNYNHTANNTYLSNGKLLYYNHSVNNVIYDGVNDNIGFFGCYGCDNVIIKNMQSANNSHAVIFANTNNSKINDIEFSELCNTKICKGIYLQEAYNNLINDSDGNVHYYDVYLRDSFNNNITNNHLNNTYASGQVLYLISSEDNLIYNNELYPAGTGVYLQSSPDNLVDNNIIKGNPYGYGVKVTTSNNVNVTNNNISVTYEPVLTTSEYTFIDKNNLSGRYGINCRPCPHMKVTNNRQIYGTSYAIHIYNGGTGPFIVDNNTITNKAVYYLQY